jgi:hypothetical protein
MLIRRTAVRCRCNSDVAAFVIKRRVTLRLAASVADATRSNRLSLRNGTADTGTATFQPLHLYVVLNEVETPNFPLRCAVNRLSGPHPRLFCAWVVFPDRLTTIGNAQGRTQWNKKRVPVRSSVYTVSSQPAAAAAELRNSVSLDYWANVICVGVVVTILASSSERSPPA